MTEPTRDALHAETLAYLAVEFQLAAKRAKNRRHSEAMRSAYAKVANKIAYAAECVQRVPELEAEVERLRAKAAIVDVMERRDINVRYLGPWRVEGVAFKGFAHAPTIPAAYAAATRDGSDNA